MEVRRTTVRDMRRSNRSVILTSIYRDGPLSRQELTGRTSLSAASVSNLVAELIAEGVVEEAGSVESEGGRPRVLLRVARGDRAGAEAAARALGLDGGQSPLIRFVEARRLTRNGDGVWTLVPFAIMATKGRSPSAAFWSVARAVQYIP